MPEPVEEIHNTPAALAEKSDPSLIKEILKVVEPDKGIKFFNDQCIVHVANRPMFRQKAYELVYNIYSEKGFTKNKDSELWLSIFDALPATTTFISQNAQGVIEGALTVVFDSPIGLPTDELYQEEIDVLRNSGARICEFISLGIRDTVKSHLKTLASLFYCAYLLAWRIRKSTDLVVTVNPSHVNFYCHKLLFTAIGPKRKYAKVNGAPSVLLHLPFTMPAIINRTKRLFPLYLMNNSESQEHEIVNTIGNMLAPMSDEEFYTFFIEITDTWANCSQQQKDFIKQVNPAYQTNHYEVSRALAKGFSKKQHRGDANLNDTKKAVL